MDDATIVFVAGWMRSGTTLMSEALGAQPNVLNIGELSGFWGDAARGGVCSCGAQLTECPVWGAALELLVARGLVRPSEYADLGRFSRDIFRTRNVPLLLRAVREGWSVLPESAHSLLRVTRALLEEALDITDSRVLVDSSKRVPWLLFHRILGAEDLSLVHLVRDPRGVAASSLRTRSASLDGLTPPGSGLIRTCFDWSWANLSVRMIATSISRRHVRVLYEDLVGDPERVIRSIAESLELKYDEETVRGNEFRPTKQSHVAVGNPARSQAGPRLIHSDDRWVAELTMAQKTQVSLLTWPVARLMSSDLHPN